jgi:hypothetical protein
MQKLLLKKYLEPLLFLFASLYTCHQIWAFPIFHTLDGPAHLYNAQLLHSLLFQHSPELESIFQLNHILVPNWIGHGLLVFFNFFFSPEQSTALVLSLCLVGLSLSFRALAETLSPKNVLLSWLILPFTQNNLVYMGFYNFNLGLALLFIFLIVLIRFYRSTNPSLWYFPAFLSLFLLLYLSHLMVLLLAIGFTMAYPIFQYSINKQAFKPNFKAFLLLAGASLPALFLIALFFKNATPSQQILFVDPTTLKKWLKELAPLNIYIPEMEEKFNMKIGYFFFGLLLISFYQKLNFLFKDSSRPFSSYLNRDDFWILTALGFLFLLFKLPDSDGNAGFVSSRLILLFILFSILWISTQAIGKWLQVLVLVSMLWIQKERMSFLEEIQKNLSEIAQETKGFEDQIPENATVLPLNYSNNWLLLHHSNYLGRNKNLILLENYECGTGYFPVQWNPNRPNFGVGKIPVHINQANPSNPILTKPVDFVFITGNETIVNDEQTVQLKAEIALHYTLVKQSNFCKLFKRNS